MPNDIVDAVTLQQGGAAWLFARVGHCTASNFRKVLARLKNGAPSKDRETYLWQLVVERLTGMPTDNFTNAAMQRGTELEPMARMKYEAETGAMVEETGFAHHPDMPFVGASCDGLIGDDGIIEIKVPFNSAIHLRTILDGMPDEHTAQVQGCLWVTGRKWADFISYDDRMPEGLSLYVQRIERDETFCSTLAVEVIAFLAEVDELANELGEVQRRKP